MADTFYIGNDTGEAVSINVTTSSPNPSIRYYDSGSKWQYTNNGTDWVDFGSGGGSVRPKVFEVVDTAGAQSLNSVVTVNFGGTAGPIDDVFSWSSANDELTISTAGNVCLTAGISVVQSVSGGRTITCAQFDRQPDGDSYSLMAGSLRYVYTRNNSDGAYGSLVINKMYTASADDKIRVRAWRFDGSSTISTIANASNFMATWTPSS